MTAQWSQLSVAVNGRRSLSRDFAHLNFVDKAPNPALSGLYGAHHRMLCGVEVFGGVTVLG
jgi:hypothetical protein